MTARHRFEALDAWRGICALLVALAHLNTTSVLRDNLLTRHAYRFVDFFFVLSGFVIAHAYRDVIQSDPRAAPRFLMRRLGRLWPLHGAVLLALVAVEVATAAAAAAGVSLGHDAFAGRTSPAALPANLLLVHGWGMYDDTTWNGPSWSISTEWLAYLVFAGLCAVAPRRWLSAVMVAVLVGSAALVMAAPAGMQATGGVAVFRCLYGFATGVLVRALWARHQPRGGTAAEIAAAVGVVAAVVLVPRDETALLVTPTFGLAVWIIASDGGALSRLLRSRPLQALATWSYSIYMVHVLVVLAFLVAAASATALGVPVLGRVDGVATLVGPPWLTAVATVAYVVAVVAVSRVTYERVERPGQRWLVAKCDAADAKKRNEDGPDGRNELGSYVVAESERD